MMNAPSLDEIATDTAAAMERPEGVSLAVHQRATAAAKKAWHTSRGAGGSLVEAKTAAANAYGNEVLAGEQPAAAPPVPPPAAIAGGSMDEAGRARSERDLAMARDEGFAPRATIYERGTRVVAEGVENARRSRMDWEAKPLVTAACHALVDRIAAEQRMKTLAGIDEIGMLATGQLVINGSSTLPRPTKAAFRSLVSRLGYGGALYLEKCPPHLRAINVNEWQQVLAERERLRQEEAFIARRDFDPKRVALRTRIQPDTGERETFAAVSEDYADFDADQVAVAIARATPPEARGGVTYDGTRSRFEVLFQTTVQPEGFVAGEFFRAGVHVTTGDTGGNSCIVRAVIWQNLCLNLIIIDQCSVPIAKLRHVGTVMELRRKFEGAFAKALKAIDPFMSAWGYARRDDVVERARGTTEAPIPTSQSEAMRGIFAGLLDRELIKVRGMKPGDVIDGLVAAWEQDESSAVSAVRTSRAAIANAITRAAHTWSLEDPWAEDELQRDAGALLWGRKGRPPAPLLYVDPELVVARPAAEEVAS